MVTKRLKHQNVLEPLPDENLSTILTYLTPFEVIRSVSIVSKYFREISHSAIVWKEFCSYYFLINEKPDISYFQSFKSMKSQFSDCWTEYRDMKQVWNRLEVILTKLSPKIAETLQPGLKFDIIKRFHVPKAFKCSLLIHSGQKSTRNVENYRTTNRDLGMFGGYTFYDYHVDISLYDATYAGYNTEQNSSIPIAGDSNVESAQDVYYLALYDKKNWKMGNILKRYRSGNCYVVADSWLQFLQL
jgi:hypothetical protein